MKDYKWTDFLGDSYQVKSENGIVELSDNDYSLTIDRRKFKESLIKLSQGLEKLKVNDIIFQYINVYKGIKYYTVSSSNAMIQVLLSDNNITQIMKRL